MCRYFLLLFIPFYSFAQNTSESSLSKYKEQAKSVTIYRDKWGIPHIYGKTDADAVFGLLYAQCEDDFPRVEMNYIEKLGRLSEIKGYSSVYNDLQIRMLIDSSEAMQDYNNSPAWLKKLLNAYAGGINYFLQTHKNIHPLLLNNFKPWYPLLWTDGSIGAISVGGVTINELHNFYSGEETQAAALAKTYDELTTGSNGFALGPSKTASGNSILYINPHVTFYFRPEVHMASTEGLNSYGAVTWGQLFIYQGFNEYCGWMHTSSYADVADLYSEKVKKKDDKYYYEYENQLKPVTEKIITIKYLKNGSLDQKTFKTFSTHHGPIMAQRDGKWISVRSNNRSLKGFMQSWLRTKATGFESYKKTMELLSNTSNNTVFADNKGDIAYWHGNFIPKRDVKYNWAKPVDGSIKETEWNGLHTLDEIIHVYNPKSGFIQNCNSTPFTVSGNSSPDKSNYPSYMAPDGENYRGVNAVKILSSHNQYTIDKIIKDGYDPHLSAFDVLIPALIKAFNNKKEMPAYAGLNDVINVLAGWDRNTSETSVAETLAIYWAEKLQPVIMKRLQEDDEVDQVMRTKRYVNSVADETLLDAMVKTKAELIDKFGSSEVAWGSINRYQRLTGNLTETFNDNEPSLPDGFAASTWGCIPSFVSSSFGTTKRYGYNGNSFVCAVEFGKRIKAKSLLTGGESGNRYSPHFNDQAVMYTKGVFKDVYFYKEDVLKNSSIKYHPGEEGF